MGKAKLVTATKPQAESSGDVFERAGGSTPDSRPISDQVQTSPATAAAVPASESPPPPRGAVACNSCSTADQKVWCTPVAPGWLQCPLCKVKVRNLTSLRAAAAARNKGGRSRAAR
jgi:hypothetical protein